MLNRVMALIVALGISAGLGTAQAAPIFYTDEASWLADMESVTLENFDGQTDGAAFHTTPVDVGAFTMSMTGTPSTVAGRNQIDAPPPIFSHYSVDGTTIANVLTSDDDSLFLTFDAPITGFGIQLASYNDDEIRSEIHVAGGSNTPEILGRFDIRFFGVVSGTPFTTVEFRGIGNDGYGIDNAQFGAAVPEPANLILFSSGMIGLASWRRSRKNA